MEKEVLYSTDPAWFAGRVRRCSVCGEPLFFDQSLEGCVHPTCATERKPTGYLGDVAGKAVFAMPDPMKAYLDSIAEKLLPPAEFVQQTRHDLAAYGTSAWFVAYGEDCIVFDHVGPGDARAKPSRWRRLKWWAAWKWEALLDALWEARWRLRTAFGVLVRGDRRYD